MNETVDCGCGNLMGYWKLFQSEPRPLLFGIFNGFFSGLGQTHFISLFGPIIIAQFQLTNTQYGSLYSLATLASAFALPLIGSLIDRMDIRYFCLILGLVYALCEVMFIHANSIFLIFLILFGIRLIGQGLLAQVSSTTIARYFTTNRGKALSLVNLGFPLAEGILTPLVAFAMTIYHWHDINLLIASSLVLIYVPLVFFLTQRNSRFNKPFINDVRSTVSSQTLEITEPIKHWTRAEVFKDRRVYLLIPHAMMPPFSLTGLIFHQAAIAELKGWSLSIIAGGLTFFAIGRIVFSFVIGPQVDRFTAKKLFPYQLIPMAMGFAALSLFDSILTPAICFGLFGIAVGIGGPIKSAIWAELYGIKFLGAIKSSLATVMVFSTALSPFLFGWYLDIWGEVHSLLWSMVAMTVLTSILSWLELRRPS